MLGMVLRHSSIIPYILLPYLLSSTVAEYIVTPLLSASGEALVSGAWSDAISAVLVLCGVGLGHAFIDGRYTDTVLGDEAENTALRLFFLPVRAMFALGRRLRRARSGG